MKTKHIKSPFAKRHIGPTEQEVSQMLKTLKCSSLSELVQKSAPPEILNQTGVGQAESASQTLPFEKGATFEASPTLKKNIEQELSTNFERSATFEASPTLKKNLEQEASNKVNISQQNSFKSQSLPALPLSESQALQKLKQLGQENQIFKNFIGQGYYETQMPPVIQRNILENPQWLTSYTPYQSEISQGRLQALLNFQTMITELTEMDVANASLLDEGTATAEAINVAFNNRDQESSRSIFMDKNIFPQTKAVVKTRALSAGLFVVEGELKELEKSFLKKSSTLAEKNLPAPQNFFCVVLQYPDSTGALYNLTHFCEKAKAKGILTVFIADPLSLCLFKTPGAMGADIVAGSVQRFGLSLSFGGPHAGYIATRQKYVRSLPGRIVGVSKDRHNKVALRLAIQTREQHIRKERATSNICTAQALLAVLAGMYALYHGPEGLKEKALHIHSLAQYLLKALISLSFQVKHSKNFFDTVQVILPQKIGENIYHKLVQKKINALKIPLCPAQHARAMPPPLIRDESIKAHSIEQGDTLCPAQHARLSFSINETNTIEDIEEILSVFKEHSAGHGAGGVRSTDSASAGTKGENKLMCDKSLIRLTPCLKHPVFNQYHSETKLLRYIHYLQGGDLSLTHSMIPLGSCTMKLNGTAELLPLSWPEFAHVHPFAPSDQTLGYQLLIKELAQYLSDITGFFDVSFQPNAGSQGEYTGLLMIQKYHKKRKELKRKICLIPSSAHGTNFASAVMAGLKPVAIACDSQGRISSSDLHKKIKEHKQSLSCFMLTYPSTFGFFEEDVPKICEQVHSAGGLVYLDGANMNSLVGLSQPGQWGADLCHLNLHKTFCIPHGGGGPGAGPLAVSKKLAPFLPDHPLKADPSQDMLTVSSAHFGSALLLTIPYMYIRLMGREALKRATQVAILNANYVAKKLKDHYKVLYTGKEGLVAHECLLDFRKFKHTAEITVEDVAKRLIDYGFHAPTMNWPQPGAMLIEPTESEDKAELDRFCSALIEIRKEIKEVEMKKFDVKNNVLKNAPHVIEDMVGEWTFPYSREQAFFPLPWVREHKFWPKVSRVHNAYGDINLFCACPPPEEAHL